MATTDTLLNRVFDNRYVVRRRLGSGGMADVYLAEDQELGRQVALKMLNERHANDEQFVERFRREAQSAAGLNHPNIVSIFARGHAEGTYYIAMEYVEGRTLKELIVARGPSPIGIAIDYSRQILSALRFAHRSGIVHRDIKPHNVIVDGDGRVKVMDFGIARAGTSQMTEAGSIIGTAQYLSPEQARGAPVDQTSDLYSAGIVLYELLTGSVPFNGDTPVEIAMKHLSQTPEPPSTHRPEIPRDLDYVILRALAKDSSERYHSAEEMDSDLERIGRGIGVSAETAEAATSVLSRTDVRDAPTTIRPATAATTAYTPGRYYEYDETRRRRSIWPWLLAILVLALAAVGGYFAYDQLQNQLSASRPVTVPDVEGILESRAVAQIEAEGLQANVQRRPSSDVPVGIVAEQSPEPPNRIEKGNFVTIVVSTGKKKVRVPGVVGRSRDDAVVALRDADLTPRVVEINSERPTNTVTGQAPKAGTTLVEGSTVRINVSIGPKPIAVPDVVGTAYESAESQLQGIGFGVGRTNVESNEPEGTVVEQVPSAGSSRAKGSTITLRVSEGPQTTAIPDVTTQQADQAREQLETAGFRVRVRREDTEDPLSDGIVIQQDPEGGRQAIPGTTVTIVVGRLIEPLPPPADTGPTDTGPVDTGPTDTGPVDTGPTDTVPLDP
ncbi:MAG: Stk1 family PASTA domain-containing Ser/Thr kinase [Actinobacteria bacterium]|nr:Stk1 family PASTA domain-containing Ser/Thr kinase [Actinomycetota bacterium]